MISGPDETNPRPDAERWRRLDALFQQAVALPPAEREAWLAEATAGDGELRAAVERLLASDEECADSAESDDFILQAIAGVADLLPPALPAVRRLGPYRLVEQIGEGGMGTVYQAVRDDDEFEQKVAIKLIRPGMDSGHFVQRFRRERQILARLDHPHIARLLDGGTTEEGLPYFVMEYIEGEPIDRYCDRRRLTVRQRLELFLTVCDAVEHAHQNLVVHRDLKPSNILVTVTSSSGSTVPGEPVATGTTTGTVKLLDFGIAKLLRPDETTDPHARTVLGGAEQTATFNHALTLRYASPEQLRRGFVTTASDVYSLGVLLYELLCGARPYDLEGLTSRQAEDVVLEFEPPLPSSAVTEASGEAAATARRCRPEQLRRQLAGDLDNVVLMALRKERQRRYGSVQQLAEDLRRHLDGRPVTARQATVGYRLQKFLRRHRWPVAAAAVFLLTVAAFTVGLARQTAAARQERDNARQERNHAQEVVRFLVDLFAEADPETARGQELTASQMLDRGAERVGRELQGQPQIQAVLFDTIGQIYRKLGRYDEARPFVQTALEQRRELLARGTERPQAAGEVARSLRHLGQLARDEGRYDEAEEFFRQSLELLQRHYGEVHREVAIDLNELALVLRDQGRYDEAETLLRRTVEVYRKLGEGQSTGFALAAGNLGLLLEARGEYEAAGHLLEEVLALDRGQLGEKHPVVAHDLNNLGFLRQTLGDLEGALELYQEALELRREVLGPRHPDLLQSLNNVGAARFDLGDFAGAEAVLREALTTAEAVLGADHPELAFTLNNLAAALQQQGEYAGAEPLLRRALALRLAQLGPEHPDVANSRESLATLLFSTGRYDEAGQLYRQVLEQRRRQLGQDHPSVAATLSRLGLVHRVRGESAEAEKLQRQALDIRRKAFGPEHPAVAASLAALGAELAAQAETAGRDELTEAVAVLRQAVDLQERLLGAEHPGVASSLVELGGALGRLGEHAEAERLLRRAIDLRRRGLPAGHWQIAEAEGVLGGCLAAQGRYDEAEPLLTEALRVLRAERGDDNVKTLQARERLESLRAARVGASGPAGGQ